MATHNAEVAVRTPAQKAGTSFWSISVNWLRVVRIAAWPISLILAAIFLPMIWGWYPVLGRSMQPTIPYVGGYVHLDRNAIPQVGNLIKFAAPNDGRICIKRVTAISPDRYWFWVSADNKGITGEDSDHYGWVHKDKIVGTVAGIISVSRTIRMFSTIGRHINILELRAKADLSPDKKYAAVIQGENFTLYDVKSLSNRTFSGRFLAWFSNGWIAVDNGEGCTEAVDPISGTRYISVIDVLIMRWEKDRKSVQITKATHGGFRLVSEGLAVDTPTLPPNIMQELDQANAVPG